MGDWRTGEPDSDTNVESGKGTSGSMLDKCGQSEDGSCCGVKTNKYGCCACDMDDDGKYSCHEYVCCTSLCICCLAPVVCQKCVGACCRCCIWTSDDSKKVEPEGAPSSLEMSR